MMGGMQSTTPPSAAAARHRVPPASGPTVLLAPSGSDSGASARTIAMMLAARRGSGQPTLHQCAAGMRAHAIAGEAAAHDSGLIVMGLEPPAGAHAPEGDTALLVIRRAGTPVLAVTPSLVRLPRRAIAAVDFSRASLHAARVALAVLDDGATLLLVNVQPDLGFNPDDGSEYGSIYARGVAAAFARLRQELDPPRGITVESVVLCGHALPELLALAEWTHADLIAAGSRRQSADHHFAPGRVTTGLVRAARHSVLVAPA